MGNFFGGKNVSNLEWNIEVVEEVADTSIVEVVVVAVVAMIEVTILVADNYFLVSQED